MIYKNKSFSYYNECHHGFTHIILHSPIYSSDCQLFSVQKQTLPSMDILSFQEVLRLQPINISGQSKKIFFVLMA